MRRRAASMIGIATVACLAMVVSAPSAAFGASPLASTGGWGEAIEVPGTAVGATISSMSCPSTGNCTAGGTYPDSSGHSAAFVVSERNDRWGTALEVPGVASLGIAAQLLSVSCASAGNCAAGGYYDDASGHSQAFVAMQMNDHWGNAVEVPGTAVLNADGSGGLGAQVTSVSCSAGSYCAATGNYADASGHSQVFVVTERKGHWGEAIEAPGTGALNVAGDASLPSPSVSCPSPGNCVVTGTYLGDQGLQPFVVTELTGRWSNARQVPGIAVLDARGAGGGASSSSVSCASAGNCVVGGSFASVTPFTQAFLVTDKNGHWGKAFAIPGMSVLNVQGYAHVYSVSCSSAGNCAAGGYYKDVSGHLQAFVVSERHGRWGKALEVPGAAGLNTAGQAATVTVSCWSAGDCAAGGFYNDETFGGQEAFVVSEQDGRWGLAQEVPGTAALNSGGDAETVAVSCAPTGQCAGGGFYSLVIPGRFEAFVVTRLGQG